MASAYDPVAHRRARGQADQQALDQVKALTVKYLVRQVDGQFPS